MRVSAMPWKCAHRVCACCAGPSWRSDRFIDHHELLGIAIAIRTTPMLRQCGERRTRLNLPDRVAVARVIHPPADFAFQAGGVADPRVVAAVAAFEAGLFVHRDLTALQTTG